MQASRIRSKVKEILPKRPRIVRRAEWSQILNQKLRKLVQKLGEAIHESVSESENIAGVVQDIRKQGFDVLLMLEATIGLNEVEQQPVAALESSNAESQEGTFTAQDLNFLKSLRIAIESEHAPE
ncbi:MAG TPA: hypothetical protein VGG42_11670 [Acidobacteriaceae bacterium]